MNSYVLVVGDCFSGYSKVEDVYTVSSLAKKLRAAASGIIAMDELPRAVTWGQGVCDHDRDYLSRLVTQLESRISLQLPPRPDADAASRGLVHKNAPQNVLISVPRRESDTRFVSSLIIDPRNELLLDHITGQHIQGMVLTEAARQMFLAVTEEHFFDETTPVEAYFVIKSMAMDFLSFVFPVDAEIVFTLGTLKRKNGGRLSIDACISVWQNGVECAVCAVAYSVFDATELGVKEFKLARATTAYVLTRSSSSEEICVDPTTLSTMACGVTMNTPSGEPLVQA